MPLTQYDRQRKAYRAQVDTMRVQWLRDLRARKLDTSAEKAAEAARIKAAKAARVAERKARPRDRRAPSPPRPSRVGYAVEVTPRSSPYPDEWRSRPVPDARASRALVVSLLLRQARSAVNVANVAANAAQAALTRARKLEKSLAHAREREARRSPAGSVSARRHLSPSSSSGARGRGRDRPSAGAEKAAGGRRVEPSRENDAGACEGLVVAPPSPLRALPSDDPGARHPRARVRPPRRRRPTTPWRGGSPSPGA